MIRIIYYRDKCIGCNSCSDLAPHLWQIDDLDGKSNLAGAVRKKNNIFIAEFSDDESEHCTTTSDHCPVGIIEVNEV